MESELFRHEAVRAASHQSIGAPGGWVPKSHVLVAIAALGCVALICAFIWFAHYTRHFHSEGLVVPTQGLIVALSTTNGTVEAILAPEGSHVIRGQPIATLASPRRDVKGVNASDDIATQLRSQLTQLEVSGRSAEERSTTRLHALETQRDDLVHQQLQTRAQEEAQQKDRDANAALLARIEPLAARGFVSAFQVQQQRSAVASSAIQAQALKRQRFELDRQLHSLDEDIANGPREAIETSAKNQRDIAQVRQALADNQATAGTVVVASESGTVSAVNVHVGEAVTVSQAIASIMPDDASLSGRMFVDGAVAAHVHTGQRVAIRLPAFPFQKYGLLYGTVTGVTSNALTPAEVSAVLGDKPPEKTQFRVDVSLDRETMSAEGTASRILPGMQLEADVLGDRRRLIEWITEPLMGFKQQWNVNEAASHRSPMETP